MTKASEIGYKYKPKEPMNEELAKITPIFIIYSISILIIGIFCLRQEHRDGKLREMAINAPNWKGGWINFGIIMWCIIMIYAIVPKLSVKLLVKLKVGESSDVINMVVGGLASQLALFIFVLSIPCIYSNLVGERVNKLGGSKTEAVLEGTKNFLIAVPLVWLTSFFWNWIVKIWKLLDISLPVEHQTLVKLFSESQSWQFVAIVVISAVIIAPVSEEFIFRVVIYRFLKKKWGIRLAFIGSGVFFGTIHFNIASFLPLVMVGLLLTRAYERTGHVLTSIVFHGLFNLNTLILLLLQPDLSLFN